MGKTLGMLHPVVQSGSNCVLQTYQNKVGCARTTASVSSRIILNSLPAPDARRADHVTVCLPAWLMVMLSPHTRLCHEISSLIASGWLVVQIGVADVVWNEDSGESAVSVLVRVSHHTEAWRCPGSPTHTIQVLRLACRVWERGEAAVITASGPVSRFRPSILLVSADVFNACKSHLQDGWVTLGLMISHLQLMCDWMTC